MYLSSVMFNQKVRQGGNGITIKAKPQPKLQPKQSQAAADRVLPKFEKIEIRPNSEFFSF